METGHADRMEPIAWVPSDVDVNLPSAARVYDYYLGGFHNFEADREMARRAIAMWPDLPRIMRANRAFLRRAVTHLVSLGVRQFLDVGAGIPTAGSVHTIAQDLAPDSRVVYVDIDPVAVAHSQALLADNANAAGVRGDLRQPQRMLTEPAVTELLDLSQPTALLLVAVLHFVGDEDAPADAIRTFREMLSSDSYLVISHATHEQSSRTRTEDHRALYQRTATPMTMRSRDEVLALFEGFDLMDPGVVLLEQWGAGGLRDTEEDPRWCPAWAGVGKSR